MNFLEFISRLSFALTCMSLLSTSAIVLPNFAWAQDFEEIIEEEFLEDFEIDWEMIDTLDALDGLNESDILDDFDVELDKNNMEAAVNEWIIIAEPSDFSAIRSIGISLDRIEPLEGLGLVMARIQTPGNLNLEQTQARITRVAPTAEIDRNHIYRPSQQATKSTQGQSPSSLVYISGNFTGSGHKIGVIDTAINHDHPVFKSANIVSFDFVRRDVERPMGHGTAILSILAGQSPQYSGLLPDAQYYTASVFYNTKTGNRMATTDALVKAISWMKTNQVSVINMSLTGPPNRILKRAIDAAAKRETIVIAAVGNDGPNAAPLYPAAYTDVIGVTAVSDKKKIYRLAGRGNHVDFSAPGVKVRHAAKNKGYKTSSGTSMAAPFVTAVVVSHLNKDKFDSDLLIKHLIEAAEDLGAKGFDPIYGYGLIQSGVK